MVSERFVGAIGIAGGSVFLAVLPFGRVTALRSVALGLALVVALWLWLARGPRSVPLLPAFGVWLAAALLSLVATHNMAASLDAIYSEVVRSFAVFFVFYVLTARLPAYRAWVAASALGFGLLSTLAVVSFFQHGAWVFYYAPLLGEFATLAITVLPLLAGYLAFARDDRRLALLCGVGLVAALIAGYLTYSRAFWLAITCGLVVAIAVHSARAAQFGRRALVALVLVCAIGLALAAIVAAEQGRELTKMEDRWPIYSAVLKKLPENPLTGTGFGHETDKPWYERALPGMGVFHPHNVVLSYLDQMGPAGLAALALLFAAPAFAFGATLRRGPATTAMPALCGLVLLTCVFVKNNLDHFFVKPGLWLFFAHLGLYLGQIERETRAAAQTASTLRRCAASLVT